MERQYRRDFYINFPRSPIQYFLKANDVVYRTVFILWYSTVNDEPVKKQINLCIWNRIKMSGGEFNGTGKTYDGNMLFL